MYKEEVELEIRMDGRNAIITGGSLGLGKAIATEFARSGANVALVARRQETLDEAKAEDIRQLDVRNSPIVLQHGDKLSVEFVQCHSCTP